MANRLCIGTSGWSYSAWRGSFYPRAVRPDRYLAHYAETFAAVELNATAYGLPAVGTVERWAAAVPADFIFAVKASHEITHRRRLIGCGDALRSLRDALVPLGRHLGPVLFQLPPGLKPDPERLDRFLDDVGEATAASPWRVVVEFRNAGWFSPETRRVLQQHAAANCVADMPYATDPDPVDASFIYLRRHGPTGDYSGSYADEALQRDARLIEAALAAGRDAYAFFNNTMHGDALADALRLEGQLAGKTGMAGDERP